MKIEHVVFPSVFFKITDPCVGRSFSMCSHDPIFGTNKSRILENVPDFRTTEPNLFTFFGTLCTPCDTQDISYFTKLKQRKELKFGTQIDHCGQLSCNNQELKSRQLELNVMTS